MPIHRLLVAGLSVALALQGGPAKAQPPPDSNLKYKEWFEGLHLPGSRSFCCSIADCHITGYRTTADGYEVPIEGRWVRVPPDKVIDNIDNPTGNGVVCYQRPDYIMCFVRGPEG